MIAKSPIFLACLLPLGARAWSFDGPNDQTHPGPGGRYGIYQFVHGGSANPTKFSTWVCLGRTGVRGPAINWEVKDPRFTGLRELWASEYYATNTLPATWTPRNRPPTTRDVGAFLQFNLQRDGSFIPSFIERFGLPTRYLTARASAEGITLGIDGPLFPPVPSQGQDFLVYDLPTGQSVALYVPKWPASEFTTAAIIDFTGNLLVPNMVELELPRMVMPRKLSADVGGKVTAPDATGGTATIGTWTMRDRQLIISTTLRNTEAVSEHDSIWLGGVEYVADMFINDQQIICDPVAGQTEKPKAGK